MSSAQVEDMSVQAIELDHADLHDVYERGDRIVQWVRAAGSVIFGGVLLINGPILGIDPPRFTVIGVALATILLMSALIALYATHLSGYRPWSAWISPTVDIAVLTITGLLLGGAGSTLPVILLVVIALNGVRLELLQLGYTVVLATLSYQLMVWLGDRPESVDRQVVLLATYGLMGIATYGTLRMARHLARTALLRQRERLRLQRSVERYFSPQVGRLLLDEPERLRSQRREVTALFADLSGFTKLSEHAPESIVMDTLDAYLGTLADVALQHDGTVDSFLGDALLVVFNAPADQPDHPKRAIRCARAMMAATSQLSEQRQRVGRSALGLVIGVNTGMATVGNIGSQERLQYTVIGDAINVASRLQAIGTAGDIVVGESTVLTSDLTEYHCEERTVHGRRSSVRFIRLHPPELLPPSPPSD